jgi:heptaprenyl diphosphate synthase
VASESEQSGKTPGTDLREGVRSLPVLHALGASRPADARLRDLLASADLTDPGLHAEALGLLRANSAMAEARADLRHWAAVAREQVVGLPDVPARAAFEGLCEYVVERTG